MEDVVWNKIRKELNGDHLLSSHSSLPLPNLSISPLGIVPKKTPLEFMLVHHLSYLRGSSMNDAIDLKLCFVKYASFDSAVAMVIRLGKGALLVKCNIKSTILR